MKKAKRFLTGLLSAALALSLCAMPAMAETAAPELPTTTNTTDSVINPDQKGSITIYKYLHADTITGEAGTGEKQSIPDGTEPAENVGFTIYRVKDATELQAYYDGETSDKVAKASDYMVDGKVKEKYNNKIEDADKVGEEKKTDEHGMVQFTNLPVGLYLVIETGKPATVTEPVEPFLVSIPMTRVTNDDNAQKQWLYDVVVYPKNSTHKGAIKLKKVGVEGENETPLAGVMFKLDRQKDDETKTWVPYTNDNNTLTTGDDGSVTIDGLKPGNYRFQEIGYNSTVADKERKYVINANDYYEFTIDKDGNVSKTAGAKHDSDYTTENTTVTVKNYAPDIEKTVKDRTTDEYRKAADYNVGDEIPYKITVTVPQNITRLKKFEVTDTPTNLVDQVKDADGNSLISVKYNNGGNLVDVPKKDAYTITKLDNGGFTVTFDPAKMEAYAGKQIVISYNAKLTANADMTTNGNSNQAKLEYSNKTDVSDAEKDNPENKYKRSDETVVYTFQIQIDKKADVKDEKGGDIHLAGVTFDLYKLVGNDEKLPDGAVEIDNATANALKLPAAGADQKWVKVKSDITTGTDGKVNVNGLANGTYYLVETKTNKGYNLLTAPVKVKLNIAYKTTWTESLEYKGDVLVKHDVTKKEETFTNSQEGTNGGTQDGVTDKDGKTYGRHITEIINRKGFNLPTTGGFGTLLFSGIGVLLVVAGVGVLLSLKKKNRT